MFLLLLSDGLQTAPLLGCLPCLRGARAALIPNALASLKARQAALPPTEEGLRALGVERVETFDLERGRPKALEGFDLLYFLGGNAFLLLKILRDRGYEEALRRAAAQSLLVGVSGGALALGGTLAHIQLLDPSMNRRYGLENLDGLGLTASSICPHRARFGQKYAHFEARMDAFQKETGRRLYLLEDGEGLLCTGAGQTWLRRG